MGTMASQITSLRIVFSTVHSGADQRKHQSSASLAIAWNSALTVEFPAQMASKAGNFPFHNVIMIDETGHLFLPFGYLCIVKGRRLGIIHSCQTLPEPMLIYI